MSNNSAKTLHGEPMETILKITQTKQAAGYKSNASIYNLVNDGLFTKPVKLGARAVGWPSSEIEAINAARIAGASTEQIRELVNKLHAKRKELLPTV